MEVRWARPTADSADRPQRTPRGRSPAGRQRSFPAVAASVPSARSLIRAFARDAELTDEATERVALAVTEAVTNAIVHAFVDRAPGRVELHVLPGPDALLVLVRDDGRGMTPRPDSPGLGLGLPMLGRLCTHLEIGPGPEGSGTEVRMHFEVRS